MTETQRRIRAYKRALPELRERVVAVALLLAMSASMLASASFAWLTISRRPEVTGVNTTVAANGNLEIALVGKEGDQPGESAVGDSSAAKGQNVAAANITWGNLVNLSDPSYGLESLTLRPAQLNIVSLLNSPLYGAVYNTDGRITQLTSNFGYTTWKETHVNEDGITIPGHFAVSSDYGVRAISSTKIEAVGADLVYSNMLQSAVAKNLAAGSTYTSMAGNSVYMQSLATMMGKYMTVRMDGDGTYKNPSIDSSDVQNLRDMYKQFLLAFDNEAAAIAETLNIQLFLNKGQGNYTPYQKEDIYTLTNENLTAQGLKVSNLSQFQNDHNTISSDYEKLEDLATKGDVLWLDSGLNNIVNNLVNVGLCEIEKKGQRTTVNGIIGQGVDGAMGYLGDGNTAIITNGILYNFELRTGAYINVKAMKINVSIKRSFINTTQPVTADIHTSASEVKNEQGEVYTLFNNDMNYTKSLNTGNFKGGTPVAEDTYGLAIDLWVRTNAANSYLTLEGNVLTEDKIVDAMIKVPSGETVNLYTFSRTTSDDDGNSFTESIDVYESQLTLKDEDGNETTENAWFYADSHTVCTLQEGEEPKKKTETIVTVIGYEGENRIWERDSSMMSTDAVTQGSGSCYVYYADSPEDRARSLKLLEAFNVAFVSADGRKLGSAIMDTEHYFAEDGRVIVPLVLDPDDSINLGEDYQGNTTYAITELQQNVPTRITAIVYLNGTKLTNQDVLAASDIQGRLNIQFGSDADMKPIENEQLQQQELKVSASIDNTTFDWDTATGPMGTKVTVHVDGYEPKSVDAFFLRKISDSQGSRENAMTFTKDANGDWVAEYVFTSPGNYVLRTVRLDGVDYDLQTPQIVEIKGFAIDSLRCDQATGKHVNIMSAAGASTVDLKLKFATNDPEKMPKTVQGRYLRDDGSAVNVNFTYNSNNGFWNGSATFQASGDYTMQYLLLDDEYVELDSGLWQTASVTLGMRVAVYTSSPSNFKFNPSEMADNEKLLGMRVVVMDNMGDPLKGLSGVKLTYNMKGSGTKKMDTDLTWNGTYYVGELTTTGPGIWQFGNVTVGSNILTSATTSPTFTIQSPEPPEYYAFNTAAYQYMPDNKAAMNAQITNSAAATVQAYIIRDGAAEGTWVDGTIGGEFTTASGQSVNHWSFLVPKDANGYQDGRWKLTALKLWDVFAADGTLYTAENPLEIDVSGTNNATKVVNRIFVTFPEGQSKDFGKDANGNITAAFMDSHTFNGLKVDIKDFENKPVDGISNVLLTFTYTNGTSGNNGGYSSNELTNVTEGATITVALDSVNGTTYTQSKAGTILYAGNYTTTFSFEVSGTPCIFVGTKEGVDDKGHITKPLQANAPVFTVWSKTPTLTISAITPTGSNPTKITWEMKDANGCSSDAPYFTATDSKTSSRTDYAATLYAKASVDNSTQHHGNFTQPTLTLTVAGVDSESTVSATLPAGAANEITFTRTGNGTIKATLGTVSQIKSWTTSLILTHSLQAYYGHGTQSIDSMTVTKGAITYKITLDHPLTITNPSSVNKTS